MTFGLRRAEILSAQFNGATLLVLGLLVIVVEGIRRLVDPPDVAGRRVLVVALVGIVVNLAATWVLAGANRRVAERRGRLPAHPHRPRRVRRHRDRRRRGPRSPASTAPTASRRCSSRRSCCAPPTGCCAPRAASLLEAAPAGLDPDAIGRALVAVPGVVEVHDLHVWEVTSGFPALSAHVIVGRETRLPRTRGASCRRCCTSASGSSTRRSRSITRAVSCSRSPQRNFGPEGQLHR